MYNCPAYAGKFASQGELSALNYYPPSRAGARGKWFCRGHFDVYSRVLYIIMYLPFVYLCRKRGGVGRGARGRGEAPADAPGS